MLVLILVSALVFAVLIFPYDDLSDLIMAKAAQQGVFLDFAHLGLSFFPPSLRLDKVSVETTMLPPIHAGEIYLSPNLMGLLTLSPGFSASIDSFLNGSVNVNYRLTHKLQNFALSLNDVDLKGLSTFAQLPVVMDGRVQGQIDGAFDPKFTVQPSGTASIEIRKLHIPQTMVPAWMALTLPDTRISKVILFGSMGKGELDISKATIGRPGDDIYGQMKASIAMQMSSQDGETSTQVGSYQISLDLTLAPKIEKNFGSMLSLLNFDQYKMATADGTRYALQLSGSGADAPPTPSPLPPGTF